MLATAASTRACCGYSVFFLDYLFLSTYFVQFWRTQMELNSKEPLKSEKKNKFRHCLFTLSIKRKIRHLHVVVVQNWQRNAKIKAWCTCKVVGLLIKPIVLLKFSLPSCRWIFVVITWTSMLDGKANGCSKVARSFPSKRSVRPWETTARRVTLAF